MFKQVKYKEAYEMVKAKAYTLHPEGVNFVNIRHANKVINEVRHSTANEFLLVMCLNEAFLISHTLHFHSACIGRLTTNKRTKSTQPMTLLTSNKSR